MFTANFDLASSNGTENEVALNMCQARGCGNKHCRVVAERRDVYNLPKQGWLDHMQQPVDPIHDTPRERMVKEGQCLRNGQYTQNFGEETSLEKAYHWVAQMGWVWSIQFPMMAIKDMAPDEDEFLRVFRIVFATAGKNQFIDPFAKEGLRSYLGVPHEMDENDGRILGGYIRYMLDVQQVPYEMVRWTKDETWIKVKSEDFTARYEMAPLDELVDAYEAQWNGAAKTLVSPEWSCVIEDRDEEDMYIKVIRKEDLADAVRRCRTMLFREDKVARADAEAIRKGVGFYRWTHGSGGDHRQGRLRSPAKNLYQRHFQGRRRALEIHRLAGRKRRDHRRRDRHAHGGRPVLGLRPLRPAPAPWIEQHQGRG